MEICTGNHDHDVLVIGLGRVGLPQALLFAQAGWNVCGVDIDDALIAEIASGKAPFFEPDMDRLFSEVAANGEFHVTNCSQLESLVAKASYIVITVGTPFDKGRAWVLQEDFFNMVRSLFKFEPGRGCAIILRTSVPVGTTDRLRTIAQQEFGLIEGTDFHLLYVPERVAEGKAVDEERSLPRLVGAYSQAGFEKGDDLFGTLGSQIIRLSSPSAAEFAKLVDNSYRNTVFAFANELARAAEEVDLDAWEIIEACNTGYPRNNIPKPGPVSGYCLGKDPYLLGGSLASREASQEISDYLWTRARRDNNDLFERIASELAEQIQQRGLQNPRMLVLGLAFKEGVDDFRMSHAFDIIRFVVAKIPGLTLSLYDPEVNSNRYTEIPPDLVPLVWQVNRRLKDALSGGADIVLIATPDADLRQLKSPTDLANQLRQDGAAPTLVYDCWNIWRGAKSTPDVVYRALGVGSPGLVKD